MQGNDVRFYKYLSPDASISVLTKKQLKWTNPALFNDPFEFPTEIAFQHDENTVADALLEEMVKIVYGPEVSPGTSKPATYGRIKTSQ
jgi:hypothetical protein